MENAERNTEINGRSRRNTLPRSYKLRQAQLSSQPWSKAMNLQVNAQILRQNAPYAELYSFPYCGNLQGALEWEILEGEEKGTHGTQEPRERKWKTWIKTKENQTGTKWRETRLKQQQKQNQWTKRSQVAAPGNF